MRCANANRLRSCAEDRGGLAKRLANLRGGETRDHTDLVLGIERRTVHSPSSALTARHVVRARLRPILADVPGVWFGRKLQSGVVGFGVRSLMQLQAIPPERTMWTNRKSPPVLCRIVRTHDGGCDLRLWIYSYGFPWRADADPQAVAFFDDWLSGLASELNASADSTD
jgi:hypothetical protein